MSARHGAPARRGPLAQLEQIDEAVAKLDRVLTWVDAVEPPPAR